MADGYGFGGEGDWKTAALVRAMKVMGDGLEGRHLLHGGLHLSSGARRAPGARRAHAGDLPDDRGRQAQRWRFIRSASAARRTRCRLVFDAPTGPALNASLIDLGNRFRLIVNEVDRR